MILTVSEEIRIKITIILTLSEVEVGVTQEGNSEINKTLEGVGAKLAGKTTTKISNSDSKINFIADSGATHHITNKNIYLQNLRPSSDKVIRCANKNKSGNIVIDGKGDLLLKSNIDDQKVIKLSKCNCGQSDFRKFNIL